MKQSEIMKMNLRQLDFLAAKLRYQTKICDNESHKITRFGYCKKCEAEQARFYTLYLEMAWMLLEYLRQNGWLFKVQEMPEGIPWMANAEDEPEMPVLKKSCVELVYIKGRSSTNPEEVQKFIYKGVHIVDNETPPAITKAFIIAILRERGELEE